MLMGTEQESGGQLFRSVQFLLERPVFRTPVSHSNIPLDVPIVFRQTRETLL